MLVFYSFTPVGIIAGALLGAVGLGIVAARDGTDTRPDSAPKGG